MLNFSVLDKALIHFDSILRTTTTVAVDSPASSVHETQPLTNEELSKSASMMRINHSGEICAQALYQGQALMAKSTTLFLSLIEAATEETNHLRWCKQRLNELNAKPSILNPVWYMGSFCIGILAGAAGDKISMGFIAETEYQVSAHLTKHLHDISVKDQKSRAVLEQMRKDELKHAVNAQQAGGTKLPPAIKLFMRYTAKILTYTAAHI